MKSFLLQVLIVTVIFNLVSTLKESSMLSSSDKVQGPSFMLPDLHNNLVNLTAGDNKTIVYFFAPWCSVCHISISNLENLYQKDSNINIIAVALDYENHSAVEIFAKDLNLSFPILFGTDAVKRAYKVSAYPSYYVLNPNNEIVHRSLGYSTALGLYLRSL